GIRAVRFRLRYSVWGIRPGRTPNAVIAQINKAVSGGVENAGMKEKMLTQGVEMISSSAEAFRKLVAEDIGRRRKVVQAAGIKVD
ncbi:MAG: hypothetical protein ACXW2L_20975, partial [Burkholderiales bacterium]